MTLRYQGEVSESVYKIWLFVRMIIWLPWIYVKLLCYVEASLNLLLVSNVVWISIPLCSVS